MLIETHVEKLTINEVAWLLCTDKTTISNWVKAGVLVPHDVSEDGELFFHKQTIAGLLARLGI